ncbi:hypothetical protein N9Y60_00895 [Crocinitomicaceae bacterium]|nr:hypothetical protein [Crocinitomicaceae bacterium]MDB3906670.1 hypothetical protein [Crocinitomicaceae bacterium]
MKTYIALLALTLSFTSYSQAPNFKHDLGLKLSTFQPESFQVQYRYHLNEKWALSANAYFGRRTFNSYYGNYIVQDSIYESYSTQYSQNSYGIDLGAVRKLSFMKHNFYYVGGSVGVGVTTFSSNNRRTLYIPVLPDPGVAYGYNFPPPIDQVIELDQSGYVNNTIHIKSRIFVGADVPIIDRLSLNVELGVALDVRQGFGSELFNIWDVPGYASGGLRYRFGKVDS